MPIDLPTFATVAIAKKCLGKKGVIVSINTAPVYTKEDENRKRFTSESKLRPKLVATESFPNRPKPSFNTQFKAAAAGIDLDAPRPIAASICCVAKIVMQELAILCVKRYLA